MKTMIRFALTSVLVAAAALAAHAAEFSKGTVKKLDEKAGKVTIIHEELKNLEMPAMTMVFRVGDNAMLTKLKEGAKIEFIAERVNGKLTVTAIK
ncbi:copper-binding protein [Rhizobium sp. KVB221]|uniref:Copper-binding protein n=1 Tax=Rhizobium setariae TaxID=2801340 RepID=A0A936YR81_9HYPH|nr:copper-binding protein [Rhizobium setariae]MBL0375238.1 copper-binding protein [Rhizobium setariae]